MLYCIALWLLFAEESDSDSDQDDDDDDPYMYYSTFQVNYYQLLNNDKDQAIHD